MQALKIDKGFIDHVDTSSRMAGLVRSIIGMGRNLSMEVVAEGVERPNQLQLCGTWAASRPKGTCSAALCPGRTTWKCSGVWWGAWDRF